MSIRISAGESPDEKRANDFLGWCSTVVLAAAAITWLLLEVTR